MKQPFKNKDVINHLTSQTSSVVLWFSALIPAYPEIQAKAHEELDRVVGRDRLPTVEDEKDMPYIHALIKVWRHITIRRAALIGYAGG